jgi:ATP:ADP antiporter, AAA family
MTAATTRATPVTFAVAGALIMMAHQVGAKSVRDSLFLSSFDIAQLPLMVIVASLFSLVLVFPASWATTKFTPSRLVPWMFLTSGVFYGGLWLAGDLHPKVSAVAVFLAVVGFGSLLTSGFWALISERLDPYTVKKAVGRIGAGGSVGVAVGGLLAERIGAMFDATVMLLVLAALHAICGLIALAVRSSTPPASPTIDAGTSRPPRSILKLAREAPYLRILAVLVLLGTISAGMIDYVFKAESAARLADKETLLRFFAMFYAITGVVTFVIQTLISSAALERFGLAKTVGMMPLSVVAGGLGALLFPGLVSTAIARGSESIFRGSLFRSGYELFYAPIPADEKRAAKPILDVGFDRLGDAAAGGAVKLILFLAPAMAVNIILSLAILVGLAGLWIALQLQEAYRDVLERNLIGRRASLRAEEQMNPSILASAVLTQASFVALGDESVAPVGKPSPKPATDTNEFGPTIEALCSGEPSRVFAVLARWNEPPVHMVAHVIPLLSSTTIYPEALRVLRSGAKKNTGQLIDALVSPETPEPVRRRLPRVLSHCRTQRCLDGLMYGLEDESFDVRQSCGRALASLHRAVPKLRIDNELVLEVVAREASLGRTVWEAFRDSRGDKLDGAGGLAQTLLENAGSQVLDHIFKILTLVIPWEPLQVAFYGLHTNDTHLRGTALEYLEGVLPAPVRAELWPYLEDDQVKERPRMSSDAALKELLRTRTQMGNELDKANRSFTRQDSGDE